jgi:hypothetical protein
MSETAAKVMEAFDALEAMKEASIDKLLEERDEVDRALQALGRPWESGKPKKPRKAVSAAGRHNMSAAQQKRRGKGGAEPTPTEA